MFGAGVKSFLGATVKIGSACENSRKNKGTLGGKNKDLLEAPFDQ